MTFAKYALIFLVMFAGMWQILTIADSALARVDIECQEGC